MVVVARHNTEFTNENKPNRKKKKKNLKRPSKVPEF